MSRRGKEHKRKGRGSNKEGIKEVNRDRDNSLHMLD